MSLLGREFGGQYLHDVVIWKHLRSITNNKLELDYLEISSESLLTARRNAMMI